MNGFERAQKAYEEKLPSYFDSVERTDDELEDDMLEKLDDMNEDDMRELLYSFALDETISLDARRKTFGLD
ncbi:hypothetical protein R0H03_10920 [Pediococcus acidilactici]|uniref:Uncharacterized protein n=1 Tax=Pediococcus acidilactici TaxID=1254 RepID=A0AAW8YPU5_PEDAC|nr:hypothetical protein [Pediococcus acidilactici]KAF0470483.1 hypothetical protein GBP06_03615 [Pediococcus acidilactici]KAF0542205.1 hypothetical protein GBP40_03610 [Pediococcus acidilactici]MDV2912335.1 hypothetical protein [Pediococcus acidilactici]WQS17270.1 hypothetical protein SGW14_09665 [Pediococcus acidilactici]